jgi:phosphoglycolate phosphatase
MYELVMFDLDGTLVDTAPEITDAVNAQLADLNLPPVAESSVRRWIGQGARRTLEQALQNSGRYRALPDGSVGARLVKEFMRHYEAHCGTRSRAYDSVKQTLRALSTDGVKLAVVSNKEGRFAREVLAAHDLLDFFDLLICGDSLPAKKPDPLPIRHCMERLGVMPARTLMIGDSEIDVAAARNAGVAVWAVTHGYADAESVRSAKPDRIVGGFSAITDALAAANTKTGFYASADVCGS